MVKPQIPNLKIRVRFLALLPNNRIDVCVATAQRAPGKRQQVENLYGRGSNPCAGRCRRSALGSVVQRIGFHASNVTIEVRFLSLLCVTS